MLPRIEHERPVSLPETLDFPPPPPVPTEALNLPPIESSCLPTASDHVSGHLDAHSAAAPVRPLAPKPGTVTKHEQSLPVHLA